MINPIAIWNTELLAYLEEEKRKFRETMDKFYTHVKKEAP
jgi:hypothetical protein